MGLSTLNDRSRIPHDVRVRFLDLSIRDANYKAQLLAAVERVMDHGRFILGPEIDQFEKAVAAYCGRRFAVGVGSGSDALFLSLRALGVGAGDEVITTPLTWVATTNAIVLNGATPVFVDIGDDLNLDAGLIEAAVTPRTKAILPVHFTGQMCDMKTIMAVADRYGIAVVEDAAQAFGAEQNGRRAGSIGTLGCFSMNPMKVFNAFGEAGVVITDDSSLAEKLCSLRYAGTVNKEDCHWPSINGRLDTIQAAMLLVGLERVEAKIEARNRIAAAYKQRLAGLVGLPVEKLGFRHTWYSYTIRSGRRDALKAFLTDRGIETKVQHPFLMHRHTAYAGRLEAKVPKAESAVTEILCLPNHQDLTDKEMHLVAEGVRDFHGR